MLVEKAVTNLLPSNTYIFRVRAVNSLGQSSDWSESIIYSTTGSTGSPGVPTGFSTSPTPNGIIVQWDPVLEPNLADYELYSSTSAGFIPDTVNFTNRSYVGTATTYTDAEPAGTTKYYYLRSVNTSNQASAFTSEFSGTAGQLLSITIGIPPNTFNVDTSGDMWLGSSLFTTAPFSVSDTGVALTRNNTSGKLIQLDNSGLIAYDTGGTGHQIINTSGLVLDTNVADIQAVAQSNAVGSTKLPSDAGHSHQGVTSVSPGTNIFISGGDGFGHGTLTISTIQLASSAGTIAITGGSTTNLDVSNLVALIQENVNAVAISGASQTIPNVTTATINEITLSANCTLTFPAGAAGKSFSLALTQDGTGSRTVTWPSSVLWTSGTVPTLTTTASKTDTFSFIWNTQRTAWIGYETGKNF